MRIPAGASPSRFLDRYAANFVHFASEGGLSGVLQQGAQLVQTGGGRETLVELPVLPHLAVGDVALTKSVALALMDDFNALHMGVDDPQRRPGVSLTMDITFDLRMEEAVTSGEAIRVRTHTERRGLNVSFCHMSAERAADGAVLASGSHVKFMRMPWPFEALMQPWLQPYIIDAVERFGVPWKMPPAVKAKADRVEQCFVYDQEGDTPPSIVPDGTFVNPMGGVHGGAMAGICIAAAEWASQGQRLERLQVRFCGAGSPTGGRLQSTVEEVARHGGGSGVQPLAHRHWRGTVTQGERARLCLTFDATTLPLEKK